MQFVKYSSGVHSLCISSVSYGSLFLKSSSIFSAPSLSDIGETKQSHGSRKPSQSTLSQEQGSTSKEQISQAFLSILSYSIEEITTQNRRARISIASKSSTTLKSRSRTRFIFSKVKGGCGSVSAARKLPQNLQSHLHPCLHLTGPTAPVFSSPQKTRIPSSSSSFSRARSMEYTCITNLCFQRRNLKRQIVLFTEAFLLCPSLFCNAPCLSHTKDAVTTTPNKSLSYLAFSQHLENLVAIPAF